MLLRSGKLDTHMSSYLVERIRGLPNVEPVEGAEVTAMNGQDGGLDSIAWRQRAAGSETLRRVRHMFLFIGAEPNTGWLASSGISLDRNGFALTGADCGADCGADGALQTSRPGVFAIRDVRSGSVKRVATGVGEGAQVVPALHAFLAGRNAGVASATPNDGRRR